MEAGEQDDFGEYADYAEGDIGPGGDGMYGDEEDFEEMEGEGMEVGKYDNICSILPEQV